MNIPKVVTPRMLLLAANKWQRCLRAWDVGPVETYNAQERYFALQERFFSQQAAQSPPSC